MAVTLLENNNNETLDEHVYEVSLKVYTDKYYSELDLGALLLDEIDKISPFISTAKHIRVEEID